MKPVFTRSIDDLNMATICTEKSAKNLHSIRRSYCSWIWGYLTTIITAQYASRLRNGNIIWKSYMRNELPHIFLEFAQAKCGWWLAQYSHTQPHTTYWAVCIATNVTATAIILWDDICSSQIYVTKGIFYMPRQHKAPMGRASRNNNEWIKI